MYIVDQKLLKEMLLVGKNGIHYYSSVSEKS